MLSQTFKTLQLAITLSLGLGLSGCFAQRVGNPAGGGPSIHALSGTSSDGKALSLSHYDSKVLLIVNTASRCGFTPQYEGLQQLYDRFKDQGFVVLGFPSNDFGNQEPGTNEEITLFCKKNYGVTFPLFEKAPVTGKEIQPIFRFLTQEADPSMRSEISWNFEKFLLDRHGRLRGRFGSFTTPDSDRLVDDIKKLLAE